ncbi:hypothetical protein M3Y97_00812900 [Aphelenchoides bicaudatus]|nr:hypothetical protein M3Y97_00812900 [Aphelenchoides bicaudatus]
MDNTNKNDVFSGSMALMANLKLTTLRPIFNHPHYEDENLRERTVKVYSMYSRRKPEEVHKLLKSLGIKYVIFEPQHCGKHTRAECTYLGMWDKIDEKNRGRPSICSQFVEPLEKGKDYKNLLPFNVVYNSHNYAVLKI